MKRSALAAAATLALLPAAALADFVILDDLIVGGSACIGTDCVNAEVFSLGVLKLKNHDTTIWFEDTSTDSRPTNDWRLLVNDDIDGGLNRFSIEDLTGGRIPFTVEAGAPENALYVDDAGNVGFGTSMPVTNLHAISASGPTLRLEQDGSGGSDPQAWDVGADGSGLVIRDATNLTIPFEVKSGAPSGTFIIDGQGNIGLRAAPQAPLHVRRENGTAAIRVEDVSTTAAPRDLLVLENNGNPQIRMKNTLNDNEWNIGSGLNLVVKSMTNGTQPFTLAPAGTLTLDGWGPQGPQDMLVLQNNGNPQIRMKNAFNGSEWNIGAGLNLVVKSMTSNTQPFTLAANGNLTITGTLTTGSNTAYPDYVFEDDYPLMPLADLDAYIAANGHLPKIPRAEEVAETGINITEMQIALLEKVEELTLYTLEQHKIIATLEARLDQLEN